MLLIGKNVDNRPASAHGDDVFVADWAPHSELFARAALIVHQGGAGTLHTALASGRPMIIVPHAHDQGDNAVRAARNGVAKVVFPTEYRRSVVRDNIRALTSDPAWRRAAEQVAGIVRAEHGADRAADSLEGLAEVSNHSGGRAV